MYNTIPATFGTILKHYATMKPDCTQVDSRLLNRISAPRVHRAVDGYLPGFIFWSVGRSRDPVQEAPLLGSRLEDH